MNTGFPTRMVWIIRQRIKTRMDTVQNDKTSVDSGCHSTASVGTKYCDGTSGCQVG